MKTTAKIQKWGNSLGLRISGAMKTIPHFKENMTVMVEVTEKGIYIFPLLKKQRKILPFIEEELLSGITPYLAHADELEQLKWLPEELDI